MKPNPYQKLKLETLEAKMVAAEKWLKANKQHPKFSKYLQQYYLIIAAWKHKDAQAFKAWEKETIETIMRVFPGAKLQS